MDLKTRKARPDEINIAFDLLYKAALWLKDNAVDYWLEWLDPPEIYKAWIKQGFDNGEFYFAENANSELAGMFRLQYEDEMFWGKQSDKAGYVHSFTTVRGLKGKQIGYAVLRMIEQTLLEKGIGLLRLDCSPAVERLCKYYEDYGFERGKTVIVNNEELRLYEKKIRLEDVEK